MKKFVKALSCALVMTFGINIAANAYTLREDFENYEIDSKQCGFDQNSGVIAGDETNKYLLLGPKQTAEKYVEACSGNVSVSVKFKQNGRVWARLFQLWDSNHSARSALVWLDGKLIVSQNNGDAASEIALEQISEDEWHELSLSLDFDNQQITQVSLDGRAMLNAPVPMYTTTSEVADLGSIYFSNEGAAGELCLDDLKIESIQYPEISKMIDGAGIYLNYTEGTSAGTYPHSSFTMLQDCIDEAKLAMEKELSDAEQEAIKAKLEAATEQFKNSVIRGESEPIYENNFEAYAVGGQPSGFLVASNAVIADENGNKVVYLNNQSRLLYRHSTSLQGKYQLSMSFMQKAKGAIEYLLDTSDSNGKGHGAWLCSDGTDILAVTDTGRVPVIENYETNVWYDLMAVLSTDEQQYTVYVKTSEETEYTECGTFNFPHTMTTLGRISNTQIIVPGVSVYIDNLCLKPYEEAFQNGANSVQIQCDTSMNTGETIQAAAEVYDKRYELWEDQTVEWSVVSGNAEIDQNGSLTAAEGYDGIIRIKAQTPDGLYECADITCLPKGVIENLQVSEKENTVQISGAYALLKYADCELTATVTGDGIDKTVDCAVKKDGTFTAAIELGTEVKTQELTVTVRDAVFGAEQSAAIQHFGADAGAVFVEKFNESAEPWKVIEEFSAGLSFDLNFSYEKEKEGYCAYLKQGGKLENIEQFYQRVAEANVIFGVKYATRETVKSVFDAGTETLKANGFDKVLSKLSSSQMETLYLQIMGYSAATVQDLCNRANTLADEISKKTEDSGKYVPSYRGGGGGGGSTSGGSSTAGNPTIPKEDDEPTKDDEKITFKDINEALWAEKELTTLAEIGAINGYQGYVRPNGYITRAEFAKIAVNTFNITGESNTVFEDVSEEDWYYSPVSVMAATGMINGYPGGRFCPNDPISRQDAAVILKRCMEKLDIKAYQKNEAQEFADHDQIADYATDAVNTLRIYGIVSGKGDNMFEPTEKITRAEAAVMLFNLYSFTVK